MNVEALNKAYLVIMYVSGGFLILSYVLSEVLEFVGNGIEFLGDIVEGLLDLIPGVNGIELTGNLDWGSKVGLSRAMMVFATVFGGVGHITMTWFNASAGLSLFLAVVCGFTIGAGTFFLLKWLFPDDPGAKTIEDYIGETARVSIAIPANGVGQIVLTKGSYLALRAYSIDGVPIAKGTQVVITSTQGGDVYVQPIEH